MMRAHAWLGIVASRVREVRFEAFLSDGYLGAEGASRRHDSSLRSVSQSGLLLWIESRTGRPCLLRRRRAWLLFKRLMDIFIATMALLLLAPISLLLVGLLKLARGGSVLSSQDVVGKEHKPFRLYKFRTSNFLWEREDCDATSSSLWIAIVDRMLIKSNLDKLPMLFNVFVGDVSLVGPRVQACRSYELTSDRSKAAAFYSVSLTMRPGLMGWAQVNEVSTLTPSYSDHLSALGHDVAYVQNSSPKVDFEIIGSTLRQWFRL